MGHFDGMKNQTELEISYKKLVSAFVDLAEDLVKQELDLVKGENGDMVTTPAKPIAAGNNSP